MHAVDLVHKGESFMHAKGGSEDLLLNGVEQRRKCHLSQMYFIITGLSMAKGVPPAGQLQWQEAPLHSSIPNRLHVQL